MDKKISELEKTIEKYDVNKEELKAIIDNIKNPELKLKHTKHHWGKRHIKIGLIGDTHIGSKYVDYSALEDLFKRFKQEHIDAVYHTGDLTEGYNKRKGHSYEVELHGSDEQVKGVVERMPFINKPIYFILGDHDHWHYQTAGVDIGKQVSFLRDDMHNLGFFNSTVELTPNITMTLLHPGKGTAYAISYHSQKIIEALSGGEKPNILAIGHFHKVEYLFYRNIQCFQTGCIQNQTPWMKRMNLSAHKGGWILDVFARPDGWIDKLSMKLIPYY